MIVGDPDYKTQIKYKNAAGSGDLNVNAQDPPLIINTGLAM